VLNAIDGCIPSERSTRTSAEIEEERRLLYVAMTRAKDDLHLIVPQRFFAFGQSAQSDRHFYAAQTRFIPDRLLSLFEKAIWPPAVTGAEVRVASQGQRIEVGAHVRRMCW
jgi:DNA helicase II / ATP-dependent DNA helicase PcrA